MSQETYRDSPDGAFTEPGSLMEPQMDEKRELRGLNSRLEQYVRAQQDKESRIKKLKKALAAQEVEYRQKLKAKEASYEHALNNLRTESERKQISINELNEELESLMAAKQDFAERLATSKAQLTESQTRCSHISAELASTKNQLEKLVNQFSSLKYRNDTHETERANLANQVTLLKEKNKVLVADNTRMAGEAKQQSEAFGRLLREKTEELETLEKKIGVLLTEKEDLQERLKAEFDTKLSEFVKQREEQYNCEKDEWVRIFKEEFNRKIRTFKDTNNDLAHTNAKQEEELVDIRKRLAQLKQHKAELESSNRSFEQELEKTRKDLDDLRRAKDMEIKNKSAVIKEMRTRLKRKEIEFDELQSVKGQLALEIGMFRQILCDAEKTAGYSPSPGPLRKKRRLDSGEDPCYDTPGIVRAAQFARKQIASTFTPMQDDMKEASGFNSREGSVERDADGDEEIDLMGGMATPGGPGALQFSSMDLSQSMLEIQNIATFGVELKGYSITNADRSRAFTLPSDRVLAPMEKVRIVIGSYGKAAPGEIVWDADVWCGENHDCARLFNPQNREVCRIEIAPDMVPEKAKSRCLVM